MRNLPPEFRYLYNPSFFFLPTDLSYFMKYEIEDRKRRHRLGHRQGTVPARVCPTAETYQNHQLQMGIKETELTGGLYTRLVLHDFLPQYPGRTTFVPGRSEYGVTKSWTGSPMAALHRAILMMGKLNLVGVPHDIVLGLRALQDIYTTPIDLNEVSDGDDGDSDAELDGNRDAELDGGKDVELEETEHQPVRLHLTRDKSSKKGKRLPKPVAPNIFPPLNTDSLHPHTVKLSLLFYGVGDHVQQAGMR